MQEESFNIVEIRSLIANGKTDEAIRLLILTLEGKGEHYFEYEEAIKISALYKKRVKDTGLGLENTDYAFNQTNQSVLALLKKIIEKDEGGNSMLQQKISELNQRLLMAKDSFELAKIHHEVQLLKKNNPDEFQLHQLEEKVEKSYNWELQRARPQVQETVGQKQRGKGVFVPLIILLIVLSLVIYFAFFR